MIENIKIEEVIDIFKNRWKLILIFILTVTLISSLVTFFLIEPQYEASTKLFIGKNETINKKKSYDNNEVIMYQKLLKTYSTIINTKDLAKLTIEGANVNLKPEELLNNLTVVPITDTQIIEIKLKNKSPNNAKKLVTSITNEFINLSKQLVPNGNVQILESVQASKNPISPNKKMNILIAMLIGLISGVLVVILLETIKNTFKSKEEIEKEFKIAVIGVIPNME